MRLARRRMGSMANAVGGAAAFEADSVDRHWARDCLLLPNADIRPTDSCWEEERSISGRREARDSDPEAAIYVGRCRMTVLGANFVRMPEAQTVRNGCGHQTRFSIPTSSHPPIYLGTDACNWH